MNRAKLPLADCPGCTPEGKEWLTMAIDPFHDFTVELMGYPDADASPTFVLVHKQQLTVSCPGTPSSTGTWGCHISMPGFTSQNLPSSLGYSNFITDPGSSPTTELTSNYTQYSLPTVSAPYFGSPAGPIMACAYQEPYVAANTGLGSQPWVSYQNTTTNTYAFGEQTSTACRIIGMGFEVHDTTPKLYQQGNVLVYQAARTRVKEMHFLINPSTLPIGLGDYVTDADVLIGPPNRIQQAALIPNSKTWDASKGCYVVARMADEVELDPSNQAYGQWHAIGSTQSNTSPPTAPNPLFVAFGTKGFNAFAPSGAMFSGLNSQNGSITINTRIIYEYFPTSNSDPFLPLSTPSAPYDALIMQHYSRLIRSLPPGVPVSYNNAGDWFKMVLRVLSESRVPSIISPYLGMGLRAVNALVNNQNHASTVARPNIVPRRPGRARPIVARSTRLKKKTPRKKA